MPRPPRPAGGLALVAALLLPSVVLAAPGDRATAALTSLDLGVARYNAGDLPAALEFFTRARDLAPERANPYRWLGLTLARMGRCPEALPPLEKFLGMVSADDRRHVEVATVRDGCKAIGGGARQREMKDVLADLRPAPDPPPSAGGAALRRSDGKADPLPVLVPASAVDGGAAAAPSPVPTAASGADRATSGASVASPAPSKSRAWLWWLVGGVAVAAAAGVTLALVPWHSDPQPELGRIP